MDGLCTNCNHPVILNPVNERVEHGKFVAISETFCYLGKDCECVTPELSAEDRAKVKGEHQ